MNGVLIKMGSLDTDMHTKRMLCEDEGKNQSGAITSQGMPKIAGRSQEGWREAWNRSSFIAPRRKQPCTHLDPLLPASRALRQ